MVGSELGSDAFRRARAARWLAVARWFATPKPIITKARNPKIPAMLPATGTGVFGQAGTDVSVQVKVWPISTQVTGSVFDEGVHVTVNAVTYVPGLNVDGWPGLLAKPLVAVKALFVPPGAGGMLAVKMLVVGLV